MIGTYSCISFSYASYTKTSHVNANSKEPPSPPKRPMNIHISASHNTLAPPPLKAATSNAKISPLATKHQFSKPGHASTASKDKKSSSTLSSSESVKNNNPAKGSQGKTAVSTNNVSLTKSSSASTSGRQSSNTATSTTSGFTTSKSFPLFCSNNNHSKWKLLSSSCLSLSSFFYRTVEHGYKKHDGIQILIY